MLHRILIGCILPAALLGWPATASAQTNETVIRTVGANLAAGQRVENFPRSDPAYLAFRLRVRSGPIAINRITFLFWNGQRVVVNRRFVLRRGQSTPLLARLAVGRKLRRLTIAYDRQAGGTALMALRGVPLRVIVPPPPDRDRVTDDRHERRMRRYRRRPGGDLTRRRGYRTLSTRPPRVGARPRPRGPVGRRGQPDCVTRGKCTPVRVFFATNRQRDRQREAEFKRISFGGHRNQAASIEDELTLGRAIVTVPRVKRRLGSINTPGWLEQSWLWLTGRSPDGDPDKHFVIYGKGYRLFTSEAGFLAEVAKHRAEAGRYKDHAFVFVHGYNTSFDLALMRTAQIAYDLGEAGVGSKPIKPFGTPFLFSWPSAGGKFWSNLLYAYDQESSRFAVEHFKHFLKLVIEKTGAKKVHLIAHSMGNVAMMNALAGLSDWAAGKTVVEQVILASPDIDIGEFKRLAARVKPLVKGLTMYASSNDAAMELSKQVHNGVARAGDVPKLGPTVVAGVHSIDISAITTCYFCTGHSEYVDQKDLLNDITVLLRRDLIPPPHERTAQLRPAEVAGVGKFWRYEQP